MMDLAAAPARPTGGEAEALKVEPWTQEQLLADEKELLGFYVSGHPLEPWREVIEGEKFSALGQIDDLEMAKKSKEGWWEGSRYSFGVLVQDVEQRFSKTSGNPFAIIRIEDFTGSLETMVVGKSYERVQSAGLLQKGAVVELVARIEHDDRTDARRLSVLDVKSLTKARPEKGLKKTRPGVATTAKGRREPLPATPEQPSTVLEFHISEASTLEDIRHLKHLLSDHPGPTPFVLVCHHRRHEVRLQPGPGLGVALTPGARRDLEPWLEAR